MEYFYCIVLNDRRSKVGFFYSILSMNIKDENKYDIFLNVKL